MMCFVIIQRMLEMINGTRQLLLHCPTSCIALPPASLQSTDDADGTDLHGFF